MNFAKYKIISLCLILTCTFTFFEANGESIRARPLVVVGLDCYCQKYEALIGNQSVTTTVRVSRVEGNTVPLLEPKGYTIEHARTNGSNGLNYLLYNGHVDRETVNAINKSCRDRELENPTYFGCALKLTI